MQDDIIGAIAYPRDSHAPTIPKTIPLIFSFSPNLSREFWRAEFKKVAPKKYIMITMVNSTKLFSIDNVDKDIIITINDIINCFFTPILSLVTQPKGAKIPNTNK